MTYLTVSQTNPTEKWKHVSDHNFSFEAAVMIGNENVFFKNRQSMKLNYAIA